MLHTSATHPSPLLTPAQHPPCLPSQLPNTPSSTIRHTPSHTHHQCDGEERKERVCGESNVVGGQALWVFNSCKRFDSCGRTSLIDNHTAFTNCTSSDSLHQQSAFREMAFKKLCCEARVVVHHLKVFIKAVFLRSMQMQIAGLKSACAAQCGHFLLLRHEVC